MKAFLLTSILAVVALAGCLGDAAEDDTPAPADPSPGSEVDPRFAFASLENATIRPGVQMFAAGGQCTSNFVFTDGADVYLGFAAHCVGTGDDPSNTDGCDPANSPLELGTEIDVDGAEHPATLAYASWGTMQEVGETDDATCHFNDFAVVKLHPEDVARTHPAMQHFGGPTALGVGGNVTPGDKVVTFGNSGLRPGPGELDQKEGYVVSTGAGGWTHTIYTVTPGPPGDSGSGVILADGPALGVLVTVALAPLAGSNGVTDLGMALDYAAEHGVVLELVTSDLLTAGLLP